MSTETVEVDVFRMLKLVDAETLEGICVDLSIDVPVTKKGNKVLLTKLLMRHLNSEDMEVKEDQGLSTFLKLKTDLTDKLDEIENTTDHINDEKKDTLVDRNFDANKISGDENLKPLMQVHRFREFKINGTVGDKDQKDTLSYTSLSFQMEQGRKVGWSPGEIQAAVIRAMKPGSNLRNYLESKVNISQDAFIKVLRSHYKEKDATAVFQEMSNSVQLHSESEHDFCLRVMSLRQKVLALSREERCQFDEPLVQKQFFHAIFTGLKYNSIRLEL